MSCFGHIKFEILTRHRSEDMEWAAGSSGGGETRGATSRVLCKAIGMGQMT